MSFAADVHSWLRSAGPFAAGVKLLHEAGCDDEALLFSLSLGETSVTRDELTQALQAVHDRHVRKAKEVRLPSRPLITKADIAKEREELEQSVTLDAYQDRQLSPDQEELRKAGKDALREMSYYRSRLETLPSDADRHRDAALIIHLDMVAVRAFARLDAWLATGRDPGDAPPPAERTEAELHQELRNIVSYLSRAASGKRDVSPAKLAGWKERKAELETKLNALSA